MQFSSGRHASTPTRATRSTYAWDFDDNGTVDSTAPNPTHTYTTNGVYTAKLTVTDSSGKRDIKTTVITVGNTSPTITIQIPADGDFFEWGAARSPTSVDGHRPRGRVDRLLARSRSRSCSSTTRTATARTSKIGCSGWLETLAEDASHGGYIAGGISVTYTDTVRRNGRRP